MADLRRQIESLRAVPALLTVLDGLAPAYLVGGAVRDMLRGADAVDLDVAVEGDVGAVARTVAERLGGVAVEHGRFGTATVTSPTLQVDLARTRRERYRHPGALPDVEPAPLAEDLARRDFTINAMAVGLSGADRGRLHDPFGGRADLAQRRVRVLHERSFVDDPTRILRALRYEARLGGRMDPETERLAREAVAAGAFATVSGARIREELLDLLREPIARMHEMGLLPGADPDRVTRAQRAAREVGADPALVALAAIGGCERLELPRDQRDRVASAVADAARIAAELPHARAASEIYELLHGEPREALALALALGAPEQPIRRYRTDLDAVRLEITGEDLLAAGVPQSPAIGDALRETLRRKLDGELAGRDAELRYALARAR